MAARYACCSADIGLTVVDFAGTAGAGAPVDILEQLQCKKKNGKNNGHPHPEHCGCGRAGCRGACCGISDAVRLRPCRWTAEAAQHEGTRSKACRRSSPPSRAPCAGGTDTASPFSAAGAAEAVTVLTVSAVLLCAAAPLRQGGEGVMSLVRVPYEIQAEAAAEQSR